MDVVDVDRGRLQEGVETVVERVVTMLRSLIDTSIRIPNDEWTVGEAAAHLAWAQEAFAASAGGGVLRHGDGTPAGLALANAALLQRFTERDGASDKFLLSGPRPDVRGRKGINAAFERPCIPARFVARRLLTFQVGALLAPCGSGRRDALGANV